ncbi:alcohol dehydrogenase catalytic domain-containing protein [Micromonospora sp. BRA006-A]|nr:alcohol dehydrogenase catalytic domain-containing protein [Micromonospora sp. BRA006-A]
MVVQVTTTAICGSDLHMYEGGRPRSRASCSATRTWA